MFWESHVADIKYGQLSGKLRVPDDFHDSASHLFTAGQNGVADTLQLITGCQSVWSVQPEKDTWVSD